MADRLTAADIACWVIKSRTPPWDLDPGWLPGRARTLTHCLRHTYRVELMRPGQLCLLWLSGRVQPGVQALGTLSSESSVPPRVREPTPEVEVTVALSRLTQPVERAVLQADHVFSGAEVLRMPAGSNPSYLSPERLDVLVDLLRPTDLENAGWDKCISR